MSTTEKKLVAYHMSRLKDKNVAARLSAIEELEKLNDPEALEALKELFDSDPEQEVQKAAQAAGRKIFYANSKKPGKD